MMVALYPHVYSLSDQLQPYTNSVVLKLLGLQPRDMLVVNTIRKKKNLHENGVKFARDRNTIS